MLAPAIYTLFAPKKGVFGTPPIVFAVNVNVLFPAVGVRPYPGITSSSDIALMLIVKFVDVAIFIKLVAAVPAPVKCNVPETSIL